MKMQTKRDIEQKIRKCIKKTAVSIKYSLIKFRSYDTIPPPPSPYLHLIEPRKLLLRFDQRGFHWLAMGSWSLIGLCHMFGERSVIQQRNLTRLLSIFSIYPWGVT